MTPIYEWAKRWGIPYPALRELLDMPLPTSTAQDGTEAGTQQKIRLRAPQLGGIMWRNNNGATQNQNGQHIRYGLGNDSKRINESFKSSDLIGITSVVVRPNHVGRIFGLFTAIEVKEPNWNWTATKREQAQWKYLQLVANYGGLSTFAKDIKDYEKCITANG